MVSEKMLMAITVVVCVIALVMVVNVHHETAQPETLEIPETIEMCAHIMDHEPNVCPGP